MSTHYLYNLITGGYSKAVNEDSGAYELVFTRYIELKVFLTSAGINLTQLDKINR